MKLFSRHTDSPPGVRDDSSSDLRRRFAGFMKLLDLNAATLKVIADMEQKADGEYLFDMQYIRTSLSSVQSGVLQIIQQMIEIGGAAYRPLLERLDALNAEIAQLIPGGSRIPPDEFAIPLRAIGRKQLRSVGSKSGHLGELKSRLNLPVPGGFAITAWAYKRFLDSGDLQVIITRELDGLKSVELEELERVSATLRNRILATPVPDDLAGAIFDAAGDLSECKGADRFSLRSSAIGEDTLFSFAGQYATYLNIRRDELVDCYRRIIASKFTPKAIYYCLSHNLIESDLAMSVCCLEMVDAAASGVIYTRNPVDGSDDRLIVNAIFGLGKFLVDGRISPDEFRIRRSDGGVDERLIRRQSTKLVCSPGGGVIEKPLAPELRERAAVGDDILRQLAAYALQIEAHYGMPQEIEWAVDQSGCVKLLQARPLRVVAHRDRPALDLSGLEVVCRAAEIISPGTAVGNVFHLRSGADFAKVPYKAILVVEHPFPGLITLMDRIVGLLVKSCGVAGHLATLMREYRRPALAGVDMLENLTPGRLVTMDADARCCFAGRVEALLESGDSPSALLEDMGVIQTLKTVLRRIAPLSLTDPSSSDFKVENCRTLHDITRYCHQSAMQEMFRAAVGSADNAARGIALKSDIPLKVNLLFLDEIDCRLTNPLPDDSVPSAPFTSFWSGLKAEGWPIRPPAANAKGIFAAMVTQAASHHSNSFEEFSYVVLSHDYMVLSLKLGFHFSTIEALATDDPSRNYVRIQHKGGGASLERRVQRVRLMTAILTRLGFNHSSRADFLDAECTYQSRDRILSALYSLGRLTMRTKQLDMALTNDAITDWYIRDIVAGLGLGAAEER